jgi:hypothetical protein
VGKIPNVERCSLTGGVLYDCAAKWYAFMAEEADFAGDCTARSRYAGQAVSLGRGPRGSIHSTDLESAIKKWRVKHTKENL